MKKTRVLVADDDPSIKKYIQANLAARGYEVLLAKDGAEAIRITENEFPDLVLLDIVMPGLDGLEVCKRIREWSEISIIMLSARDSEADRLRGFDCGADDYLSKPFSLQELLARIRAVLRRSRDNDDPANLTQYRNGMLQIDFSRNAVLADGKEVGLTPTEYRLLSYMVLNAGRVVTNDYLMTKVWGDEFKGDERVIQVHIGRLRKKIRDNGRIHEFIQTKHGLGYLMKENSLKINSGTNRLKIIESI